MSLPRGVIIVLRFNKRDPIPPEAWRCRMAAGPISTDMLDTGLKAFNSDEAISPYAARTPEAMRRQTVAWAEAGSSRVAQLAIIDVLVSAVAQKDPGTSIDNLEHSARIIAEKRY